MKRLFVLFLILSLSVCSACLAETANVEAVFVKDEGQMFVQENGSISMLDTAWVYYSNLTFEQYAIIDDEVKLFSQGTYRFEEGSDFDPSNSEKDLISITRSTKYNAQNGLQPYQSEHLYDLYNLGYTQILNREKDAHMIAAFLGAANQPYGDEMVDSLWLYYGDQSFEQYAYLDYMHPTLFSEGYWKIDNGTDLYLGTEKENDVIITLTRTKKLQDGSYMAYASEHTYELKTLGYEQIVYVKQE